MKGIKVFIAGMMVFDLSGCSVSSSSLGNVHVDRSEVGGTGNELVTFNDDGVYFADRWGELFFKEDGQEKVSLGYINYVDGKNTNIYSGYYDGIQEKYSLMYASMEYYDGRIYTMYGHYNASGGDTYELCSLNAKGEDLQSHITFEYMPESFMITDGKVYVCTTDPENHTEYITVYDGNFKEEETNEYDSNTTYANGFYIVDGEVKVPNSLSDVDYDDGNVQLSRRSQLLEGTENAYELTGIYDKGNVHVELKDRVIEFVNDQYFYAYYVNLADTVMEQVYERYNLDGTLDTSIRIKDWITSDETISHMDFGGMINLRGKDQTFGLSQNGLFTCDFSSGECEYLYDDANESYE